MVKFLSTHQTPPARSTRTQPGRRPRRDSDGRTFARTTAAVAPAPAARTTTVPFGTLFHHMAATVQDVFWLASPDLKSFYYASPAFERVWGLPCRPQVQSPAPVLAAAHPEDYVRVRQEFASVGETPRDIHYRIVRPDGSIRWIRNRVHRIPAEAGRPAMLAGAATDVTDQKLFQKSLIESHARFVTVLDGIDADIYVADPAHARDPLCQHAPAQGPGAGPVREEMPHGDLPAVRTLRGLHGCGSARHARAAGGGRHLGGRTPVDRPVAPFLCARHHLGGRAHGANPDRHRHHPPEGPGGQQPLSIQAHLQQAQKMEAIGTLAGGIAHDFNNILTAVLGYTEIALMEVADGTPVKRNLEQVLQAGNRARELVRQILTFSRQTEPEFKPVELNLIVQEALTLMRASLPSTITIGAAAGQPLRGDGGPDPDPPGADQPVHQRGPRHERPRGRARGWAWTRWNSTPPSSSRHPDLAPGTYQRLTVRDSGHGIDPAIRERIFEPFFTTKQREEGTGMGLSVVLGIVRSHKGTITVDSVPGKGSTFEVYLPIVSPGETRGAPSTRSPGCLRGTSASCSWTTRTWSWTSAGACSSTSATG